LPAAAERRHEQFLQRALPLHRKFRAIDFRGSHLEPSRRAAISRVQRGQPCDRDGKSERPEAAGRRASSDGRPAQQELGDEFAVPGAPEMDFVFTVCDSAAKEACPVWPGHPITAHWSVADPGAVEGTPETVERAFRDAYFTLEKRIELFLSLPHQSLDALELKARCAEIGAAGLVQEVTHPGKDHGHT
jgi:hypothetical protein